LGLDLLKLEDLGFSCGRMLKELLAHVRNSCCRHRQAVRVNQALCCLGEIYIENVY
jgi:hypothetical protein